MREPPLPGDMSLIELNRFSTIGFLRLTDSGKILQYNAAAAQMSAGKNSLLIGRKLLVISNSDDLPNVNDI